MAATLTVTPLEVLGTLRGRNLLAIRDLTRDELLALIALAADVKARPASYTGGLPGKAPAMIFDKPSLRSRVSFDIAKH